MNTPIQAHAWKGLGRRTFFRSVIETITSELVTLLTPDHPAQAEVVANLNGAVQCLEFAAAASQFASLDMWGDAGSVCDVSIGDPALDQRKCELLMLLVKAFARVGIRNQQAIDMASTYQLWLELGFFK